MSFVKKNSVRATYPARAIWPRRMPTVASLHDMDPNLMYDVSPASLKIGLVDFSKHSSIVLTSSSFPYFESYSFAAVGWCEQHGRERTGKTIPSRKAPARAFTVVEPCMIPHVKNVISIAGGDVRPVNALTIW